MNKLSIKEIKDRLKDVSTLDDPFVQSLHKMSVKASKPRWPS
jgi:ribonuclease HII